MSGSCIDNRQLFQLSIAIVINSAHLLGSVVIVLTMIDVQEAEDVVEAEVEDVEIRANLDGPPTCSGPRGRGGMSSWIIRIGLLLKLPSGSAKSGS